MLFTDRAVPAICLCRRAQERRSIPDTVFPIDIAERENLDNFTDCIRTLSCPLGNDYEKWRGCL